MTPEELALIEAYLAELRAATVRYGQEAFPREDAAEARRHADRLDELDRADRARLALAGAIEALRDALAAFPPLPADESPAPPPSLAVATELHGHRPAPISTQLAEDLDGELMVLRHSSGQALLVRRGEQWIVKQGSEARSTEVPSFDGGYLQLRQKLKEKGALVQRDARTLVFARDVAFNAPSPAASVVLGRHANGRTEWRRCDGRTLHRETLDGGDP